MTAVLGGFAALAAVIGVGWVTARTGVLGAGATGVLSRLSYYVATPALLLLTLADADPAALLTSALVATGGSAVCAALVYLGLARWWWRLRPAQLTTGALASSYVNAGNLGVPIAVYVLGDASYVAPVLLFQVLVLAPIGLSVLAGSQGTAEDAPSRWRVVSQPVRTPVVLGCVLGLLLAETGLRLPSLVLQPIELLAALAVPAALLAFGSGLLGAPRPASGDGGGQVWLAVALKTLVQPAVAYALGRWVVDLSGVPLLAVTLTSALPTAQNVFVYATAYDRGTALARDVVLVTTVLSVPVLVGVAVVLG
ncbi:MULTISPECIES: AEC family transporter [unclassified Modestobacter]|uniref:AEC family transporter n=1 Tax=unclassified Modestobacter TaxID=2643866 RepID=UPI0022AA1BE8|nr:MULTISPECIES: AEC family transporter [unclassified Modestobacter]MCZ2826328.1 AEC family transporter [Modestobacter sp. VKM Ac-2981]MCZ2852607.1 AEC family transporter [Modestobacter sp. VKM Ac-2982]